MCKVLLQVADKNDRHRGEKDWGPIKRGDVIVVMPDSMNWGRKSLTHDRRAVHMPGVHEMLFVDWAEPAFYGGQVVCKRMYYFRLDSLEASWLNEKFLTQTIVTLNQVEMEMFMKLKALRPSPVAEMLCLS